MNHPSKNRNLPIDRATHNRPQGLIRLVRPQQWIKNGVVLLPMIFGGKFLDAGCWSAVLLAAICFCFASSAIYCLNDVMDADYDRIDAARRLRPVASGAVSAKAALLCGVCCALLSLGMAIWMLPPAAIWIVSAYMALNVAYCLWLKQIALVDVIIVATGFVLRIAVGGVSAQVWISQWIVIMVFLLALFLALAKRRYEVVLIDNGEKEQGRKSVAGYNIHFLDISLGMLAAVILIGYILYTLQPRTMDQFSSEYLYLTALPVLCGLMRYLQLTIVDNQSGNPSRIICADRPLQIIVAVWFLSFLGVMLANV